MKCGRKIGVPFRRRSYIAGAFQSRAAGAHTSVVGWDNGEGRDGPLVEHQRAVGSSLVGMRPRALWSSVGCHVGD